MLQAIFEQNRFIYAGENALVMLQGMRLPAVTAAAATPPRPTKRQRSPASDSAFASYIDVLRKHSDASCSQLASIFNAAASSCGEWREADGQSIAASLTSAHFQPSSAPSNLAAMDIVTHISDSSTLREGREALFRITFASIVCSACYVGSTADPAHSYNFPCQCKLQLDLRTFLPSHCLNFLPCQPTCWLQARNWPRHQPCLPCREQLSKPSQHQPPVVRHF